MLRYHPDFSPQEIKKSIESLFNLDLEIITPTLTLLKKAIDIGKEEDVTCYDATYLALAEELHD
jgi:predicted nucleic acid-binding protein